MTEFYDVELSGLRYLVCRETDGRGRPVLTIYCDRKSPPKIRRRIEKAIVEARHG